MSKYRTGNHALEINCLDRQVEIEFPLGSRIGIEVRLAVDDPVSSALCPEAVYIVKTYVSEKDAKIQRSSIYIGFHGEILRSNSRGNE
ncbi:hypothetical protein HYT51_00640 [Candidatus Woesearchaeota archaeon]|nr:hypothetical protein [Candidatus Woesearchaeota archaeon]